LFPIEPSNFSQKKENKEKQKSEKQNSKSVSNDYSKNNKKDSSSIKEKSRLSIFVFQKKLVFMLFVNRPVLTSICFTQRTDFI